MEGSRPTVQRTLVKSPPELWADLSNPETLARRLGEFGEIRITRLVPEKTVAWEGERASGTVELEPSGWGTKVRLSAKATPPASEEDMVREDDPERDSPLAVAFMTEAEREAAIEAALLAEVQQEAEIEAALRAEAEKEADAEGALRAEAEKEAEAEAALRAEAEAEADAEAARVRAAEAERVGERQTAAAESARLAAAEAKAARPGAREPERGGFFARFRRRRKSEPTPPPPVSREQLRPAAGPPGRLGMGTEPTPSTPAPAGVARLTPVRQPARPAELGQRPPVRLAALAFAPAQQSERPPAVSTTTADFDKPGAETITASRHPRSRIPAKPALDDEQTLAVLAGVLDDLGAAHHRPFSRERD